MRIKIFAKDIEKGIFKRFVIRQGSINFAKLIVYNGFFLFKVHGIKIEFK